MSKMNKVVFNPYRKDLPWVKLSKSVRSHPALYVLVLPVFVYFIVFHYMPIYGLQIAFKDFIATKGIIGSPWVGFSHLERFFHSFYFWRLISNTLEINIYQLVVGFPAPIILALLITELSSKYLKKTVQMITYAPHFISTVVLVGMIVAFLSPTNGIVNRVLMLAGLEPIFFMIDPKWFKTIYVFSDVWQNAGWGSIIYIAALAGIDLQLYEAAIVDGASKLKRIWHITLPGILPTVVIMLILGCGKIMNVGFDKVFLMQNNLNMESSDVISTFIYRNGLLGAQYSFASAVGLFNSLINFILLFVVNFVSKRVSQTSLW